MSYNVDNLTIEEMAGFTLPRAAIEAIAEEWEEIDNQISFCGFDVAGMSIAGDLTVDDRVAVRDLRYYGNWSGNWWNDFEALLKQSTGYLRARVTWAGGDSVQILTVKGGAVTAEEV